MLRPHKKRSVDGDSAWGFTLIEIMVVLMIIGLFVGLVSTITRPDDNALLRLETERLAQLLDLAGTEARLTGKRIAWTGDAAGYRFWRLNNDSGWLEIKDVDALRPRLLPDGVQIERLTVENSVAEGAMRLEFTSFAPPPAFLIDLKFGKARYAIAGSPIGDLRILPDGQEMNNDARSR